MNILSQVHIFPPLAALSFFLSCSGVFSSETHPLRVPQRYPALTACYSHTEIKAPSCELMRVPLPKEGIFPPLQSKETAWSKRDSKGCRNGKSVPQGEMIPPEKGVRAHGD